MVTKISNRSTVALIAINATLGAVCLIIGYFESSNLLGAVGCFNFLTVALLIKED